MFKQLPVRYGAVSENWHLNEMSIIDYAGAAKHIEYCSQFPIWGFFSQYIVNIYLPPRCSVLCSLLSDLRSVSALSVVGKYKNLWQDKKSSVISEVNLKYDDKRVFFQGESEDIQLQ